MLFDYLPIILHFSYCRNFIFKGIYLQLNPDLDTFMEYQDSLRLRISDINYGGHLGHVEFIHLLHETRMRFLRQFNLSESDIQGHALIMRNLNVTYKYQAFWNDELHIHIKLRLDGAKIIFSYHVKNHTQQNDTGLAEAVMMLVNKDKRMPVKPDLFMGLMSQS